MPPEIYEALAEQLGGASPSRASIGLIQQLKAPSSDIGHLWAQTVLTLVGLRILSDQQGWTSNNIATAIATEALRLRLVDAERVTTLRDRLGTLLGIRPVILTSKAFDLATEHEHPFVDARILTDIRMVFEPQGEHATSSAAALIVHVLKLRDMSGDEYYMSLGRRDLRKLQAVIERALLKEQELRDRLSKAEVQCLDEPEVEDSGASE